MDYRANEKIQISIFKYAYLDFLIGSIIHIWI